MTDDTRPDAGATWNATNADGEPPGQEVLAELLIALTARWRSADDRLAIGAPRDRLQAAAGTDAAGLDRLLDDLGSQIAPLGLEVVDYYYDKAHWFCVRSEYAAPNELSVIEQGVLGTVIGFLEGKSSPESASLPLTDVRQRLVNGRYVSRYQLDKTLQSLEDLGFLVRKKSHLSYGPRLLIEFSAERRANVAAEARSLIF